MKVLRQNALVRAGKRNLPLRRWLDAWTHLADSRNWQSLEEVRDDYPSADGVCLESGIIVTIFNVKGNDYRLLTSIRYSAGIVIVLEVLTHADYDKELWKRRY